MWSPDLPDLATDIVSVARDARCRVNGPTTDVRIPARFCHALSLEDMAKSAEFVIAWTTLPPDADVPAFARTLVEERLAACVTVHAPVHSVYLWHGSIEEDDEQLLLIKTTARRVEALWERLRQLHPYDVPEFVVLPIVDGNAAYLNWIRQSTDAGSDG